VPRARSSAGGNEVDGGNEVGGGAASSGAVSSCGAISSTCGAPTLRPYRFSDTVGTALAAWDDIECLSCAESKAGHAESEAPTRSQQAEWRPLTL